MRRICLVASVALLLVALSTAQATASTGRHHQHERSLTYPRTSHPFGVGITSWGEQLAKWVYRQPAAHNPQLDQTGAECANQQRGPVWFIPPIDGPRIENSTRTCTIPRQKSILLDIGMNVMDYPCPDVDFRPEPGESMYHFLIRTDRPIMDSVDELDVSLDGRQIRDVLSYRYVSRHLVWIKGHPSMQVFDSCITGSRQPAIVDGFFLMFKPLRPGAHVLHVHGTNTFGDDKTYTYNLTVH